ncbi:MAG: NTP transferase domain-containing protein [Planctomycetes bacterium]|nr:NTP transferase domain-containing protein [Planctomycetota bacterium]
MAEPGKTVAIVLAAGRGERLGADKALVDLGGEPAVARLVRHCRAAGCARVVVVRRQGAAPLPPGVHAVRVDVDSDEMIESLRAGLVVAGAGAEALLIAPVDFAMVDAEVPRALLRALAGPAPRADRIALPICRGRPGHPLALTPAVAAELATAATLRDVVRRDPTRIVAVAVDDGFVLRDLDEPADLLAARGALAGRGPATELMARHRSRRAFRPEPVGDAQLRWLVDSARFASTSSFGQSYAAVVVRDPARKDRIATLCADQQHIRDAPVFVAVCADLSKIARACERHGGRLDPDPLETFLQAVIDAALFGQNLQLAAESEGLGSCMIGAARDHPVELAELLGLPPLAVVLFGLVVGWPADDPEPRGRMPLDAVLHEERYDSAPIDSWLDGADELARDQARRANARGVGPGARPVDETRGWTDRMWWLWGRGGPPKGRERLLDDLRRLGFGIESKRRD